MDALSLNEKNVFDVASIKQQFPILQQQCRGKPLIYLDSGATAQKPESVIEAIRHYYQYDNANVHRGVYQLSERATQAYEQVREQVRAFINAEDQHEIIFTRGTTEAINLVAHSFGALQIKADDEIVLSYMEHHSNIVPWQMLCEKVGCKIKIIPLHEEGTLDLNEYAKLLTPRTKLVSIIHVSNVLGTVNPIEQMIALAHQHNIPVLIDGAQAVPRMPIDVKKLDCDFYAFSGHKLYGPTSVGVLYGKRKWLEAMPPYQGGGDMISRVSFNKTEYNVLPYKFEAGTPNIAAVIGLGAAIQYLESIGMDAIQKHEIELTHYAQQKLSQIPGLKIYGHAKDKMGVISFTLDDIHAHDVGTILDNEGIAIRAGHHCAMPLMEYYKVAAMARASLGIYNQKSDIDALVRGLLKVKEIFGRYTHRE